MHNLARVALLLIAASLSAAASSINLQQCQTLAALHPNKVSYAGSKTFVSSISSYFFVGSRLSPTCVVTPTSTEDVSTIVKTLAGLHETDQAATFAIRSGGHSPNIGASGINHGVTIDLRSIRTIEIKSHESIASVGAGATWANVYAELVPRKLGAVGGRVAGPGLGGLITGGGISFFSPEKGFASDNVLNMEVVLADGEIIDANATSHPDLFAALKGGSNNFGIVTRFDLETFFQDGYWGGAIEYPQSADSQQLAAFAAFKDPASFDPYAEVEHSYLYMSALKSFVSANNMFYTKPVVNPPALQPFVNAQPQLINTMRISNISDFAEELEVFQPVNQQGVYATNVFRASAEMITRVHSLWRETVPSVDHVANLTYTIVFQSVPPVTKDNIMGIDPASEPEKSLVLCLLSNFWEDESDSPTVLATTKNLLAAIEKAAEEEGASHQYQYLNYAASWQHPLESYGKSQLRKLREVGKKYDPKGLFQTGVPGGFKLNMSIDAVL